MKQHEDCVMWTGILGNPGNHIPPESVESKVVAADNFSMGAGSELKRECYYYVQKRED